MQFFVRSSDKKIIAENECMNLIVIVGGSAGLGLVLAEQSAVEGAARVVLVARNAERLATACSMLGQKHPRTEFLSFAPTLPPSPVQTTWGSVWNSSHSQLIYWSMLLVPATVAMSSA